MVDKEARLQMIKNSVRKINLENKGKLAMMAAQKPHRRSVRKDKLMDLVDKIDDSTNINAWADADQFARKEFGDVYEATTRFDNEWN